MEAIAAMIGSETAAAAATSEEEAEREIQIVEIFNQDVAISGVALAARVLRVGESITSLSLSLCGAGVIFDQFEEVCGVPGHGWT